MTSLSYCSTILDLQYALGLLSALPCRHVPGANMVQQKIGCVGIMTQVVWHHMSH